MAKPDYILRLVRVVGDDFVAGFETDGRVVRLAAPILKRLVNMEVDAARRIINAKGWQASFVTKQPTPGRIVQHTESMEVQVKALRAFYYFDDNAGRRAISGRPDRATALLRAQAYLKAATKGDQTHATPNHHDDP